MISSRLLLGYDKKLTGQSLKLQQDHAHFQFSSIDTSFNKTLLKKYFMFYIEMNFGHSKPKS